MENAAKELLPDVVSSAPTEIIGTEYITQFSPTAAGNTEATLEFPILFGIWIMGVFVVSLFFLVCSIRCRREFLTALPVGNRFIDDWIFRHRLLRKMDVRVSDRISSPLTYGTLRPIILLPKKLDWEDKTELISS